MEEVSIKRKESFVVKRRKIFLQTVEKIIIIDKIFFYIRNNIDDIRDDLALMSSGEGYVDFSFYPENKNADVLILKLKVGNIPDKAIAQIKDNNYVFRFKGKLEEKSKYTRRILAVVISYNEKINDIPVK